MQVVRVHGIEKSIRSLSREAERQRRRRAQRAAEDRRPLVRGFAAGRRLQIAKPRIALARRRPHLDDAARLEAELRRDVPDHDVDRLDHLWIGRDAVGAIHPLVHRHAVDDIQKPVIHAARVHQAVIFGRPSRRRRNGILQSAAADANGRAPHGVARERRSCRGRDRLICFGRHVHLFGERGRELQLERNRKRVGDGQTLDYRFEWRRFRLQRVAADRHVGEPKLSVVRRDGRHGVAELVEKRDTGFVNRGAGWSCEGPDNRPLLQLSGRGRREEKEPEDYGYDRRHDVAIG